MGAIFFGAADGVRTPVVSPTYFGLSSQPEDFAEGAITVGLSENLLLESCSGAEDPVFPEITRGGLAGLWIVGFISILGGGCRVSCWKGASEMLGPGVLGVGGPASRGVLNAFSQDP